MRQPLIRKAVFPLGGLGTRFLPATKAMPKEMLPVVDKPLIQYAVEEAREAGIEQLIFVTGRSKTIIEDHFDHSYELSNELQIRNSHRQEEIADIPGAPGDICYIRQQQALGLGHAVWCARHLINDEPFAVILADDFIMNKPGCLAQMISTYQGGNMVAVMDVPAEETSKYGILDIDHQKENCFYAKNVVEKPAHNEAPSSKAIIGRYLLSPKIFDILAAQERGVAGEIQLTDALQKQLPHIPLTGYAFEGHRFDCGSRQGLLAASIAQSLHHPDLAENVKKLLNDFI